MLMKISKLHLSYSTKSCRHTLSPNEKILRHIYFFVAFCDNGDRQLEPCGFTFILKVYYDMRVPNLRLQYIFYDAKVKAICQRSSHISTHNCPPRQCYISTGCLWVQRQSRQK